MIDSFPYSHCVCQKYSDKPCGCADAYTISEQGKSVRLIPRAGEKVMTVIIDGCVITDNQTKCDGLFLYRNHKGKYSFLVELKGAGEIEKAFDQLSYTRDFRTEYQKIIGMFQATDQQPVKEHFVVVVSNGSLSKPRLEALERQYRIRIKAVLHSEATTPIPDLKTVLR